MTTNDEQIIDEIIDSYIQLPAHGGRQQRQEKTHQEWKRILQRESRNGFGQKILFLFIVPLERQGKRIYLQNRYLFQLNLLYIQCQLTRKHCCCLLG